MSVEQERNFSNNANRNGKSVVGLVCSQGLEGEAEIIRDAAEALPGFPVPQHTLDGL